MWTSHHPYHSFLLAHPPISSSQDKTGVKPSVLSWIHITKMRELNEANILYCGGIVLLFCKTNLYPTFLKYFFKTTPPPSPPCYIIQQKQEIKPRLSCFEQLCARSTHQDQLKVEGFLQFLSWANEQFCFPVLKKGKDSSSEHDAKCFCEKSFLYPGRLYDLPDCRQISLLALIYDPVDGWCL